MKPQPLTLRILRQLADTGPLTSRDLAAALNARLHGIQVALARMASAPGRRRTVSTGSGTWAITPAGRAWLAHGGRTQYDARSLRQCLLTQLTEHGPLSARTLLEGAWAHGYTTARMTTLAPMLTRAVHQGQLVKLPRDELRPEPCRWAITDAGREVLREIEKPAAPVELSPHPLRTLILHALSERGDLSSRVLGDLMRDAGRKFRAQNVYSTLKSYQDQGWVNPVGSEIAGPRRMAAHVWTLTDQGREMLARDLAQPHRLPLWPPAPPTRLSRPA